MVCQRWRGLFLIQQSMLQNEKRATLRDKLFTNDGVYTHNTSNNSVVKLSPNRTWAHLCTALKMDKVMSDDDTQRPSRTGRTRGAHSKPPITNESEASCFLPLPSQAWPCSQNRPPRFNSRSSPSLTVKVQETVTVLQEITQVNPFRLPHRRPLTEARNSSDPLQKI